MKLVYAVVYDTDTEEFSIENKVTLVQNGTVHGRQSNKWSTKPGRLQEQEEKRIFDDLKRRLWIRA